MEEVPEARLSRHGYRPGGCARVSTASTVHWRDSLKFVHLCTKLSVMRGSELLKQLRKLGRNRGIPVTLERRPGKGSHGRLYFGDRFTTLKDPKKEIGPGLLRKMLRDLDVDPDELN